MNADVSQATCHSRVSFKKDENASIVLSEFLLRTIKCNEHTYAKVDLGNSFLLCPFL